VGLLGAHAVTTITSGDLIFPRQDTISINIAHRRPIRSGIEEAMPVEPAMNRASMGQHEYGLVFADDVRVSAPGYSAPRSLRDIFPGGASSLLHAK